MIKVGCGVRVGGNGVEEGIKVFVAVEVAEREDLRALIVFVILISAFLVGNFSDVGEDSGVQVGGKDNLVGDDCGVLPGRVSGC